MPGLVGISQVFIKENPPKQLNQMTPQFSRALNSSVGGITTSNLIQPCVPEVFQSNVILLKDNDPFEEMIEAQIELDYQPRQLSLPSSIDTNSDESEEDDGENGGQREMDNNNAQPVINLD